MLNNVKLLFFIKHWSALIPQKYAIYTIKNKFKTKTNQLENILESEYCVRCKQALHNLS